MWIDEFRKADAEIIWQYISDVSGRKPPHSITEMIKAYTSPGSIAATLKMIYFGEELPVACGGIMNQYWARGEAWLLDSPLFQKYPKESYSMMKTAFEGMIQCGQFQRIQCISYLKDKCSLFRHLGFKFEATLKKFGPEGQDGFIYSLFPENGGV